jgi:hypothetical protein
MEMIKQLLKYRSLSIALLFVLLAQACAQMKLDAPPALPTAREIESVSTEERSAPLATSTALIKIPAATEMIPTSASSLPKVTISAVKGNIFIRRGPDLAFNSIDVLYKNTSAKVIARDVLSKWVEIEIPNSDKTGWVSLQTQYSQIEGKIQNLPEYTPTEWPVAAYVRNCTHHQMYVLPFDVVIPSSYEYPDNETWIYPGSYTVFDIDVPGEPEVAEIVVMEGSDIEIRDDGLGEHRKCP